MRRLTRLDLTMVYLSRLYLTLDDDGLDEGAIDNASVHGATQNRDVTDGNIECSDKICQNFVVKIRTRD